MAQLQCVVVTPESTVLDEQADFVALPLYDGEIGIAPGRSPLIGRLGFGELRLKHGGTAHRYFIAGGFVQVVNDVISVLTNRAVPAESLDPLVAAEQLKQLTGKTITGDEAMATLDQARAQLRVAKRAH